jgi:hypothetical protein
LRLLARSAAHFRTQAAAESGYPVAFASLYLPALRKANDYTRILKIREQLADCIRLVRQNQVGPDIG